MNVKFLSSNFLEITHKLVTVLCDGSFLVLLTWLLWLQDLEEGEEDDEKTSTGKDSSDDTEKSDKEEDSTRVGSPKVKIAKIAKTAKSSGLTIRSMQCEISSIPLNLVKKHQIVLVNEMKSVFTFQNETPYLYITDFIWY